MLSVEYEGLIARVTLNRPEVRNALNAELIEALQAAFDGLPPGIRAVVLSGEGDAFCAGADLNWMRQAAFYTEEENYLDARAIAKLFETIAHCPAVVIARVQGAAYGGGAGLVAACDVALASDAARFAFSEVKLGLVPATISPYVLSKIGPGAMRALFATGEVFDAQRAYDVGLVHFVGPLPDLDRELVRKLESILASGPAAIAVSKGLALHPPLDGEASARLLARVRSGEEAKEGIAAFLEKRRPGFAVER
jgi:enoyl-CoA hydratase/carnithine racemase